MRRSAESAELTPQDKAISCRMVPQGATMLEYGLRFLAGGIAVSAFTALGDSLRPKSFAGLFGAAASIALATLLITLSQKGAPFVAMESRSMIVGLRAGPAAAGQIIRDPVAERRSRPVSTFVATRP